MLVTDLHQVWVAFNNVVLTSILLGRRVQLTRCMVTNLLCLSCMELPINLFRIYKRNDWWERWIRLAHPITFIRSLAVAITHILV